MLPLYLLLVCVVAVGAREDEAAWNVEATVETVPSTWLSQADLDPDTLATMELTLHGLHMDADILNSPDSTAHQSELISILHSKVGKMSEALQSFQKHLEELNAQVNGEGVHSLRAFEVCNETIQFPCGDGTCLDLEQKCDGVRDCVDGADEKTCGITRALCGSKQWACVEGYQCISIHWRCDGDMDCADNSDEYDCGSHRCAIDEFECGNSSSTHQCIPRGWRCDGQDDCHDSSDERGCVRASCNPTYFKCTSGDKCIHNYWRCDGEKDCFDGSDEADCHSILVNCTDKQFECASHNQCILKEKVCDGAGDCHDLSDEAACPATPSKRFPFVPKQQLPAPQPPRVFIVNSSSECQGNRFLCATGGMCIPLEWRCDRDDDCPDSSDEVDCVEAICLANYFRCSSGDKCVHMRWRCDGDFDCFDKSDEEGCSNIHVECVGDVFKCALHGQCVPRDKVCDGVADCTDGSDEVRCGSPAIETSTKSPIASVGTCGPFQSQCASGDQCIASGWWCDNEQDCIDGSDEKNCPQRACRKGEFTCQDTGRCLPFDWYCDGQRDCLDGDDEVGCHKSQAKRCELQRGQFACQSDGKCLSHKKVCDGRNDCTDGSDEGTMCGQLCPTNLCSDGCFMTPFGPQCTCPPSKTLDDLGNTCVGGLPSPFVLVGRRDALEAFSLDGSWNLTVYGGKTTHSGVIKVAYDPVDDEVYWSVVEMAGIYKRDLLKKNPPQFVLDTDETVVEALAIDYLGRNMYIMDGRWQVLLVCTLKGFICTTILSNTTSSPRSLQLDLHNRVMFWTDWKAGVVESSDMDGSRRSVLVDGLDWPNALAIDSPRKRLYWMDAASDTLESILYDGTDRRLHSKGTVLHVYAMDAWNGQLFFTDWSTSAVYKCDLNKCDVKTPITDTLPGSPYGIEVVHVQLLEMSNPCANQPCSHICLLSATAAEGYRCSCPIDMMLRKDFHNCIPPSTP